MAYLVIFISLFVLAIISKSVGLSLVAPLIFVLAFQAPAAIGFGVAFFGGLILSLVGGTRLGLESAGLLLAAGLIGLYRRRFSSGHWIFFVVFAVLGSLVYSIVTDRNITPGGVVADVGLVFLFRPLVYFWLKRFYSETIVLRI